MELKDRVVIPQSRDVVWAALNDPDILRQVIPGCEELEQISPEEMTAKVVLKVGPIKARFVGAVTLSEINAPESYILSGEGKGGVAGFAKGAAKVVLEEIEEDGAKTTVLHYDASADVGGKIAQLGARLLDTTAQRLAKQFFNDFSAVIISDQSDNSVGQDGGEKQKNLNQEGITCSLEDGIATVILNRPEKRNSVTYAMWQGLGDIFNALSDDKSVRAIIFTGQGDDFSVGADISEFASIRDDEDKSAAYEKAVDYGCHAIANAKQPVIAVIKGYCLGGGAHLAMSCDFRFAHKKAIFGIPAAKLSIIYGVQATRKLLALVGLTQAKKILFSAEQFNAAKGLQIGFFDDVSRNPLAAAQASAHSFRSSAPLTIAGAKYILNGIELGTFEPAKAEHMIDYASASKDYKEGREAFAEKRSPRFCGE